MHRAHFSDPSDPGGNGRLRQQSGGFAFCIFYVRQHLSLFKIPSVQQKSFGEPFLLFLDHSFSARAFIQRNCDGTLNSGYPIVDGVSLRQLNRSSSHE